MTDSPNTVKSIDSVHTDLTEIGENGSVSSAPPGASGACKLAHTMCSASASMCGSSYRRPAVYACLTESASRVSRV
jgi:hypothetical protein